MAKPLGGYGVARTKRPRTGAPSGSLQWLMDRPLPLISTSASSNAPRGHVPVHEANGLAGFGRTRAKLVLRVRYRHRLDFGVQCRLPFRQSPLMRTAPSSKPQGRGRPRPRRSIPTTTRRSRGQALLRTWPQHHLRWRQGRSRGGTGKPTVGSGATAGKDRNIVRSSAWAGGISPPQF